LPSFPKNEITVEMSSIAKIMKKDFLDRILFLYSQLKNSKAEIRNITEKTIIMFFEFLKKFINSFCLNDNSGKLKNQPPLYSFVLKLRKIK
tara:strand:+ start:290 stop:562 length:273 start_codon:yes stop_codon:yes gene_type:complete